MWIENLIRVEHIESSYESLAEKDLAKFYENGDAVVFEFETGVEISRQVVKCA